MEKLHTPIFLSFNSFTYLLKVGKKNIEGEEKGEKREESFQKEMLGIDTYKQWDNKIEEIFYIKFFLKKIKNHG